MRLREASQPTRLIHLVPGLEEQAPARAWDAADAPSVEILLPAHNAWHFVRPCLESLDRFTDYPRVSLTILDDGSDETVREQLEEYAQREGGLEKRVVRRPAPVGFVKNANGGLRNCGADYALLINSDTVVTPGWLGRLVDAAESNSRIACVMPMSNECSFHSLAVPMGWNIFQYAADLGRRMRRTCFDAVTASGFCVLLRQAALQELGVFDEAFGPGYGEESDWCMRARDAGWLVTGAEDVFVFHRGRGSHGDLKERSFKHGNYQRFMSRWSQTYSRDIARYAATDALAPLREAYVRCDAPGAPPVLSAFVDRMKTGGVAHAVVEAARYIRDRGGVHRIPHIIRKKGLLRATTSVHRAPRGFQSSHRPRVTYVLEKFSVSGGVLSVVQHVNRLLLMGWDAKIATHHHHDQSDMNAYTMYHQPYVFSSPEEMVRRFPESDIVVATLWSTVEKVRRIVEERLPDAVPWYFMQDDETRFLHRLDRHGREAVRRTWSLIPNRIVKTDWLGSLLADFGLPCHKVSLGLDLDAFYPRTPTAIRPPKVLALARPHTPRRGFDTLVQALRTVKRRRPDVKIGLVGCDNLADHRLDFEHEDLGVIPPERMQEAYNDYSVFLDTSEYQGFGRMGIEAMACGAAAVLTRFGGITEYAEHDVNCLLIDPSARDAAADAVLRLVDDVPLRERLVAAGLQTVLSFSCEEEAVTMSELFARSLGLESARAAGSAGAVHRRTVRAKPASGRSAPVG